jgi:hypothetical protein
MVVLLGTALGVPLRQLDAMLRAAGHPPRYADDDGVLPTTASDAIRLLKAHHEPFPLVVVDRRYQVRDLNDAAARLFLLLLGDSVAEPLGLNLARLTFDEAGARPFVANFADVGRELLWRIQREVLTDPDDGALQELLDELLELPTVDPDWRRVDLSSPSDPALLLHLRAGDIDLRFVTVVTAFQAPQNVALEHLRIETWLPVDAATEAACRALAATA